MGTATATRSIDYSRLSPEQQQELIAAYEARQTYRASSEQERARIQECARLEADFTAFIHAAWAILEPGNRLSWSWHYDLIAEYLTLAAEKKIKRLIINIPPRTLKSILISIMFPVWVWTRTPNQSFAVASYAQPLSDELSVKRRRILQSEWFVQRWGHRIQLQPDQNQKSKFQNNSQAQMFATSVGGTMQGIGGQFLITDDALKADEILSEATVKELHNWFDKTWMQRLNDPSTDVIIIVEQRIGESDLTGHCLENDKALTDKGENPEWTHLCIPMEADEEAVNKATLTQKFVYPISGRVKERPLGDVLQPDRFTPAVIASKKVRRLTWATQEQGRPSPMDGNWILRSDVRYYGGRDPETQVLDEKLPERFDLIVTSVDAAFKDLKTSDFVCVGTIGVSGRKRFVLEVVNKHLDAPATETETRRQRDKWKSNVVLIEDKANGTAIIKSMKRNVPGVVAVEPEGGKLSRFMAMVGEWQGGDWYVSRTEAWEESYVSQITKFPGAKNDDMADMTSQAALYFQKHTYVYGLTEYVKQQEAEMAKKIQKKVATHIPANATAEDIAIAKIDNPSTLTKPDVDDSTPRCDSCGSTFIQRTNGGKRCGQCGTMLDVKKPTLPATTNFGEFRK